MLNSTPNHILHSNQLQKLNAEVKANIEKIKQERIAQLPKMRRQEMLKEVYAAANAQKNKPLNKPVDFKNIDKIIQQLANTKKEEKLEPKALLQKIRAARTRANNLAQKNKSDPKGSPKSVTTKKPGRPRTKPVPDPNATQKRRGRPPKPKAEPVLNATPKRRGRPPKSVPAQQ